MWLAVVVIIIEFLLGGELVVGAGGHLVYASTSVCDLPLCVRVCVCGHMHGNL